MSLTDDQVNAELRKMKAFIEKEAQEKAKEIRLKADEEYEIEKASIVRSETAAIDSAYEQKLKKASLAQQITKSTIGNKTRLKVLGEKEKILDEIFEQAEKGLVELTSKKGEYKPILEGLIEEVLYALYEDAVVIKVREADVSLAKEAAEEAAKHFEEKAKFSVSVTVDEANFLDASLAGGVIAVNKTGKIEVNNTLEERLKLLSEEALPGVRLELFGPSPTRKFFD
ncbi:putative V-type proton ATPase subunit E [Clavispora lusitaniae]|nr:V-ATPase V1 sector subunit E [Clavispora lusitaniae]KAF7582491.1 V-type proton ATPase subunit E [Clavispora lusitaniae]OVF11038.1 putative H(+)-transporting V1 sector ATPase subunit [Clavispora lusitaniae]QFZ28429.1 putative V-type proton ATPase subunit E [Clavispora lusitaniae]QFZ34092.1 putative V-type proton ATPase subunit E [Clavispora lusitaniae]